MRSLEPCLCEQVNALLFEMAGWLLAYGVFVCIWPLVPGFIWQFSIGYGVGFSAHRCITKALRLYRLNRVMVRLNQPAND